MDGWMALGRERWRPQPLCLSPGAKALAETEDTLGRVLGPREGPEPDRDSLPTLGPRRPWRRRGL